MRRQGNINDGTQPAQSPSKKIFNPYTEFKDFTRKQIKDFEKMFKKYVMVAFCRAACPFTNNIFLSELKLTKKYVLWFV